jgi:hypothetical protein
MELKYKFKKKKINSQVAKHFFFIYISFLILFLAFITFKLKFA